MSNESGVEQGFAAERGDTLAEVRGQIKAKLLSGMYDVLKNYHQDILELSSGDHRFEHQLTRREAELLERALWSAGEDELLEHLLSHIESGLQDAGFNLSGDDLDISVRLRAGPGE